MDILWEICGGITFCYVSMLVWVLWRDNKRYKKK